MRKLFVGSLVCLLCVFLLGLVITGIANDDNTFKKVDKPTRYYGFDVNVAPSDKANREYLGKVLILDLEKNTIVSSLNINLKEGPESKLELDGKNEKTIFTMNINGNIASYSISIVKSKRIVASHKATVNVGD